MSRGRGPDMEKTEMRTQFQTCLDSMSPEVPRELVMRPVERDLNTPQWCICHNCKEMPKAVERKCCGNPPELCVSKQTRMDKLVLDPEVLLIGVVCQANLQEICSAEVNRDVKASIMRQAAYRNCTLWLEGPLGRFNRKPVPSCCTWRIRDRFPDSNKKYTGFYYCKRFASKTLSQRLSKGVGTMAISRLIVGGDVTSDQD